MALALLLTYISPFTVYEGRSPLVSPAVRYKQKGEPTHPGQFASVFQIACYKLTTYGFPSGNISAVHRSQRKPLFARKNHGHKVASESPLTASVFPSASSTHFAQ
jgi:hypothetical protein